MADASIPTRPASSVSAAVRAIRAGEWDAGLTWLDEACRRGEPADASACLLGTIARIRSLEGHLAVSELDADMVREANGRTDLRRLVVGPLMREGALDAVARVLDVMVAAFPGSAADRRTYASVLGRLKRWDEAIVMADAASGLEPSNLPALAARIQLRLQAGQNAAAAAIARQSLSSATQAPEEAHVWIQAMLRAGDGETAARLAVRIGPVTERMASAGVQALLAGDRLVAAISFGRTALQAGFDSPGLRTHLAKAHLARATNDDRHDAALEHLHAGVAMAPGDLRLNSLYGETLLRAGRFAQSLPYLERSCELAPELGHTRAMYARALRHAGHYDASAEQWLRLATAGPDQARWQRAATAALTQAGRIEEAARFHDTSIARRAQALPATFAEGFDRLWERVDGVELPQARLDWAWTLRQGSHAIERAAWERAARWGHAADHYLLEWIECRPEGAAEVMELLADLDDFERFVAPFIAAKRGFIVAAAHVGPMYGGLLMFDLLDLPGRWLASTPSIAQNRYSSSLISVSDQTEIEVAKASLRALQAGLGICLAIDGALNPAAARITFEQQEMTYSSFAARAAYRCRVPSAFGAPRWKDGRIDYQLVLMPSPEEGESIDDFSARWQGAWLAQLRAYLGGPPENLRLSGGLWRHIRTVDRTAGNESAAAA